MNVETKPGNSISDDIVRKRDELFSTFSRESDRGLILVSSSFLDEILEQLLRCRFSLINKKPKSAIEPLFNSFGPLTTFSSKIKIAYANDLIEKWMYKDLEVLRKLRNEFAHSIGHATFELIEVTNLTEKLVGAEYAARYMNKNKPKQKNITHKKSSEKFSDKAPTKADKERVRTLMTVSYIGGVIHQRVEFFQSDAPLMLKLDNFPYERYSELQKK